MKSNYESVDCIAHPIAGTCERCTVYTHQELRYCEVNNKLRYLCVDCRDTTGARLVIGKKNIGCIDVAEITDENVKTILKGFLAFKEEFKTQVHDVFLLDKSSVPEEQKDSINIVVELNFFSLLQYLVWAQRSGGNILTLWKESERRNDFCGPVLLRLLLEFVYLQTQCTKLHIWMMYKERAISIDTFLDKTIDIKHLPNSPNLLTIVNKNREVLIDIPNLPVEKPAEEAKPIKTWSIGI